MEHLTQSHEKSAPLIERFFQSGRTPENFHQPGEVGFYPKRIVDDNDRFAGLLYIISTALPSQADESIKLRLMDLIIHNSYGRIFPLPNNASDFIGVVEGIGKLKNCIALVKVKGNLAVAGGFNDVGEPMTHTLGREAHEEMGVTAVSDIVMFGQQSKTIRDNRFTVLSTVGAGNINPHELKAGSDAQTVTVVRLADPKTGELIDDFFRAGTHKDSLGRTFSHDGLRGDHGEILLSFYKWWEKHRVNKGESFEQVMRRMSSLQPQKWFSGYEIHPPGSEQYPSLQVGDAKLLLTPNISFTLDKAIQILAEAGVENPSSMAALMLMQSVKADILPLFPQAATTVDCVIAQDDNLLVFIRPDGLLSLPGRFYSPEPKNSPYSSKDPHNIVSTLDTFSHIVAQKEFGIDFRPKSFLGTVGGDNIIGHQADERYPRLSYVFAGTVTPAYQQQPGDITKGSEILTIPIWKDKAGGVLSDEITEEGWAYSHNIEIVVPLLGNMLRTLDPKGRYTAEQVLRRL